MDMNNYYLSSLDYENLEQVRNCKIERIIKYKLFKKAAFVKIDIPIEYDNKSYDHVFLISRHKGFDISKIKSFPFFVYVCIIENGLIIVDHKIVAQDFENIGSGELYESEEAAIRHFF